MSFDLWLGLNTFLRTCREERLMLSFEQIEEIIGEPLPTPFRGYAQPWQNQQVFPRVAGYRPSFAKVPVGHVAFVRIAPGEEPAGRPRKQLPNLSRSFWRPLIDHLTKYARPRLLLTIGEIAEIIGRPVPLDESKGDGFWTDPTRPWAEAGFRAFVSGLPRGMVAFENARKWNPPVPMAAPVSERKRTHYAAVLVAGGAEVSAFELPARQFFTSAEFLAGRQIAESLDCPWCILSPLYGLLGSDDPVAPHPAHLARLAFGRSGGQRKQFVSDLQTIVGSLKGAVIAVHSEKDTRRMLAALLGPLGAEVVPLEP